MSDDSSPDPDLGPAVRSLARGQRVFGRYELRRKLGEGGFGSVWLAWDHELQEEIAIKFVLQAVAGSPEAIDSLRSEAARSRRLTHPNIIRIHDFISETSDDDGVNLAGISMEYVEGESLAQRRLSQPGRCFDVEQIEPWIEHLCQALAYAHAPKRRVIHRDLKPANLLLSHDGELKVADFGIACSLINSVSLITGRLRSGTPPFMSPQQLMGDYPSEADDIYALGATIYALLTGTPPFSQGNLYQQILNKIPSPMTERRDRLEIADKQPIPQVWEEVVAACLAKETAGRPPDAAIVAARLGLRTPISTSRAPVPLTEVPSSDRPGSPPSGQHDSGFTSEIERPSTAVTINTQIPPSLASVTLSTKGLTSTPFVDTAESSREAERQPAPAINARRLLWAAFIAMVGAGAGFALRGSLFANWARDFGLTGAQLGGIGGAGFSGYIFGIFIGGLIADKLGYGRLIAFTLGCYLLSAVVTFGATTPQSAYYVLYWGLFIFAYANGSLDAVVNPLVATLFPQRRTQSLNLLHASWPAGVVLGSLVGWTLGDRMQVPWKLQLALSLVPTVVCALMFLRQGFPKSEAAENRTTFPAMLKDVGLIGSLIACSLLALFFGDLLKGLVPQFLNVAGYALGGVLVLLVGLVTRFSFGSFLLLVLYFTHSLVGMVDLVTDGWLQNITATFISAEEGKYLFVWSSSIIFVLRLGAYFLGSKLRLSPIGLLFICASLACFGLFLASGMSTFAAALVALGVYSAGKAFIWPTMLAVVGDRFPRSGAIAMAIIGGIGMLSAGLIGGPAFGYAKDRFAGENLRSADPALYEEYKAATPTMFLSIPGTAVVGLDGRKLGEVNERLASIGKATETSGGDPKTAIDLLDLRERAALLANIDGDRRVLRADAFIPMTLAAIYLLLFLYFKASGGYRPLHIAKPPPLP